MSAGNPLDQLPDAFALRGRQAGERLVEQQYAGTLANARPMSSKRWPPYESEPASAFLDAR
jgi:hypothetical protein